jgi:cytochrome oxidase Cu insertion factor (SCO1/SenC/PrrC family)
MACWRVWLTLADARRTLAMLALVGVGVASGAVASSARADGDPASDYLVSRQVFFSSLSAGQSPAQRQLVATVAGANRAGFAIRVAVISSEYDLGSITALWHRPGVYARFLGLELSGVYRGRLLVAMPNGFGFYWAGHSVASADRALAGVSVGSPPDDLPGSAGEAVRRLAAAAGITLSPVSGPARARAASSRGGGVSAAAIGAAVLVLVVLAAVVVAISRRLHGRGRPKERPAVAAGDRSARPRWALPGVAVLCGVALGAPIVVLALVRRGGGAAAETSGSIVTPPAVRWPAGRRPAPGFVLRDQSGRRVSVAAYRGRPVVVTFIDPLCRNLCPLEAKVLNDVVGRLPASQRPEILAVSVDVYGGADSRADLLQDVRKWELVPQWRWAVGRPGELAAVWRHYGVGVKVTTRRVGGTTINYITHTEAAFVVDRSGHERALFFWPFYPQDLERTLRQLT